MGLLLDKMFWWALSNDTLRFETKHVVEELFEIPRSLAEYKKLFIDKMWQNVKFRSSKKIQVAVSKFWQIGYRDLGFDPRKLLNF